MLTLFGNDRSFDCGGFNRRDFLRIGSLGVGGMSLPALLAAKADARQRDYIRDKSIVLLFCCGGPSLFHPVDWLVGSHQRSRRVVMSPTNDGPTPTNHHPR